jgi:Tfp pilus assembly protein PilO
MTPFQERLITFGPLAIGLTIAFALTYPTFTESQREHDEVTAKKMEYEGIMARAADRDRLSKIKTTLQSDIDTLRKTIPRAPYLDLLMLDVEHMANESKVDIIGLEAPEKANSNTPETNDVEEIMKARTEAAAVATVTRPSIVVKKEEPKANSNPFGIKQLTRRLYITGDYDNLIAFMHRLEAYQRIISMKNLALAIVSDQDPNSTKNTAAEKAQKLKLNKPVMTFLLNVYYLP